MSDENTKLGKKKLGKGWVFIEFEDESEDSDPENLAGQNGGVGEKKMEDALLFEKINDSAPLCREHGLSRQPTVRGKTRQVGRAHPPLTMQGVRGNSWRRLACGRARHEQRSLYYFGGGEAPSSKHLRYAS